MIGRFEKLFRQLPTGIDCVLITSDVNRRYFTGMRSSAGTVLAFRDKVYLLIDFRYIEKARSVVKTAEVIEQKKLYTQISQLIREHGAASCAIESQMMTVSELSQLRTNLPDTEIISTDALSNAINALRSSKTETEIGYIRKAQEIAEEALEELLPSIKPGVSEREIALQLNHIMFLHGAEDLSFDTIVLSGANTSMPHGVPSGKLIQEGEFVLIDFGAVWNGYHSDMTRTFCIGKPTEEMERVYDTVLEAQNSAIRAARSGMTGKALDLIARSVIDDAGYGDCFGHSLGHGVGLEIHEKPNAAPNNTQILCENAVVTIEPGIYIAGRFGVRIEDFVVLHENGCDNITKFAKNLITL